jgi:hypothetical protein
MKDNTDKRDRPESPDKLEDLSSREKERYADQLLDQRLSSDRVYSGLPGNISLTPMGNGMK